MEWTTSLAQGSGQPYVTMAGYGIADQNNFGANYWMLDVDMDCEQAFDDGKGNKWFELQRLIASRPGPAVVDRRAAHHPNQQPDAALLVAQPYGLVRYGQRLRRQLRH